MIEVTIFEGTDGDPLKRVYFQNSKGWTIRESFYNHLNQIVVEEMVEFDEKMKVVRHVLFDQNHNNITYRNLYQHLENQREDKRSGCTDYKFIDGQFKRISHNIYEPASEENPFSKTMFYDQNGNLFYYMIDDTTRIFENIRVTKYFDHNGQQIEDFDKFFIEKILKVETYDSIKNDLLQKARDKYSDDQ